MKRRFVLLLSLLLPTVAACAPTARLRPPDDFASLEAHGDYVYRAASPDGTVIAVRREANKPEGSLKFWTAMVDSKLRESGYEPDGDARDAKTRTGLAGREMRYTRKQSGRSMRYWVTVFVAGDRVWIVEAGGDAEKLKGAASDSIEQAIASVTIG